MEIKGQIAVEREEGKNRLRERDGNGVTQVEYRAHNAAGTKDTATVSAKAKEIYQCVETRAERIDAIKKAINCGEYSINAMHVAKKVLDEI